MSTIYLIGPYEKARVINQFALAINKYQGLLDTEPSHQVVSTWHILENPPEGLPPLEERGYDQADFCVFLNFAGNPSGWLEVGYARTSTKKKLFRIEEGGWTGDEAPSYPFFKESPPELLRIWEKVKAESVPHPTFVDLLIQGGLVDHPLQEAENHISYWQASQGETVLKLHEWLGMSLDEYNDFVSLPKEALYRIFKKHLPGYDQGVAAARRTRGAIWQALSHHSRYSTLKDEVAARDPKADPNIVIELVQDLEWDGQAMVDVRKDKITGLWA